MLDGGACRIRVEVVAPFPILLRPDRPGTETSAAIRADIVQEGFNAGTAKGAFERANHRLRGMGRQRRVAVLASRSQLEHGSVLMCSCLVCSARTATIKRVPNRFFSWPEKPF